MKPRKIRITLDVVTAAPMDVLRDRLSYSQTVIDQKIGSHFLIAIERVQARELEPWEEENENGIQPEKDH